MTTAALASGKQTASTSTAAEFSKTLKTLRKIILKDKGFVEKEINTGYSYFKGSVRLVKLVKSSKSITLEINTDLAPEISSLPGMKAFPYKVAHQKHLGTMKFLYETKDSSTVNQVITEAMRQFKFAEAAAKN